MGGRLPSARGRLVGAEDDDDDEEPGSTRKRARAGRRRPSLREGEGDIQRAPRVARSMAHAKLVNQATDRKCRLGPGRRLQLILDCIRYWRYLWCRVFLSFLLCCALLYVCSPSWLVVCCCVMRSVLGCFVLLFRAAWYSCTVIPHVVCLCFLCHAAGVSPFDCAVVHCCVLHVIVYFVLLCYVLLRWVLLLVVWPLCVCVSCVIHYCDIFTLYLLCCHTLRTVLF